MLLPSCSAYRCINRSFCGDIVDMALLSRPAALLCLKTFFQPCLAHKQS